MGLYNQIQRYICGVGFHKGRSENMDIVENRKQTCNLFVYEDVEFLPLNCDESYSFEKLYNLLINTTIYLGSKKV